jgi:hypothetical protein
MFDRRPNHGADLDRLPDPLRYTVGHILRKEFRKAVQERRGSRPLTSAQ